MKTDTRSERKRTRNPSAPLPTPAVSRSTMSLSRVSRQRVWGRGRVDATVARQPARRVGLGVLGRLPPLVHEDARQLPAVVAKGEAGAAVLAGNGDELLQLTAKA